MTDKDSEDRSDEHRYASGQDVEVEELIDESVTNTDDGGEVRTRVYNDRVEIIRRSPDGGLEVQVRPDIGSPPGSD